MTRLMTIAEARKASVSELVDEILASSRRTGSKRISIDPVCFFEPDNRGYDLTVGGDVVVVPR